MKIAGLILAVIALLSAGKVADAATTLVRMSDKAPAEVSEVVEELKGADVIFVGDVHDDSQLHRKQLEIVRSLYRKIPRLAIGLEMFATDSQRYLDDWSKGKIEEKDFEAIYAKEWSYNWPLYRDIFIFARDNHIPMIALNVPKPIMAKVVRQGAKALSESDRKVLPPGRDWTLNPRQAEYLRRIRGQVFGKRPVPIPLSNLDQAQALRNDSMAYNIAKFREKFPESKVLVIAGTWHAIRNGAPASLNKYGRLTSKVVLPDLVEFARLKPTLEDVDYLIPAGR